MAYARGHGIFGRDSYFASLSGKALISFKETRNKNHRSLLAQNLIVSNQPHSFAE